MSKILKPHIEKKDPKFRSSLDTCIKKVRFLPQKNGHQHQNRERRTSTNAKQTRPKNAAHTKVPPSIDENTPTQFP